MAHLIEIDGVKERIYVLMEVALAAEQFVSRHGIGVEGAERFVSKEQYWRHTKSIVSNFSLEIAVKLRNAAELLDSKGVGLALGNTIHTYSAGRQADGTVKKKDFRYICNKIIHAKSFYIDAIGSTQKHEDLIWWAGTLTLAGTEQGKNGKGWSFFFNILEFCEASLSFLDQIEENLKNIQLNSEDLISRRMS